MHNWICHNISFHWTCTKLTFLYFFYLLTGRSRHHQRYTLNNKASDAEDSPAHTNLYAQPYLSAKAAAQYNYQKNLSKTPSSENGSEATLTESELAYARDNTLLVQKGKYLSVICTTWHSTWYGIHMQFEHLTGNNFSSVQCHASMNFNFPWLVVFSCPVFSFQTTL